MSLRPILASLCLIVAAFPSRTTEAQPNRTDRYISQTWTEADGFPATQAWTLAQDSDGYIWIGSDAGLIRFDGVRFVTWDELGRPLLPSPVIRALRIAVDGSFWIAFGGGGGIVRFHEGRLTTFETEGPPRGEVHALMEAPDRAIWMAQDSGLWRFASEGWRHIGSELGIPAGAVFGLFIDDDGTVWAATADAIYRQRTSDGHFERFSNHAGARAFVRDFEGTLWTSGGSLHLTPLVRSRTASALLPELASELRGTPLLRDRHGNLWLGTFGTGVVRIDLSESGHPKVVLLKGRSELSSEVARSFLEDREGNIWIGTQRSLNRLSRGVVTSLPADGDSSMSRFVRAVTRGADADMWIGSSEGLYRAHRNHWTRYAEREGLPSASVSAVHLDKAGNLWVATRRGVGRLVQGRFAAVDNLAQFTSVSSMTSDRDGHLWICDGLVIARWSSPLEPPARYPHIVWPQTVFADSQDRVWVGTRTGDIFVNDRGRWRSYSKADGLTDRTVTSAFEDRDGALWFGIIGGLSYFNGQRFVTLDERNGLPGKSVQAIVQDKAGDFWLGLNSGIMRTSQSELLAAVSNPPRVLRHTFYDSSDGLRGTPISMGQPIAATALDGTVWFTTSDGAAVIDPLNARRERLPAAVRIENVIASGQAIVPEPDVQLAPRTTHLEIDYTALSFVSPSKLRFRYRLDGIDEDWVDAGARRRAFYTNLPPGRYKFRVAASNGGIWSESEATWDFSVAPTFVQTRLFLATCVAAGLLLLVGAWRLRERQVRRGFTLVLAERTRVAREIHDTVIQNMVGVALQFDSLASELQASPAAVRAVDHLRRLVELSIREARQAILDLRSPSLERRTLAEALRESGERITGGSGVRFAFEVIGSIRSGATRTEQQILRIGQEAVTNAVRHARASRVQMELRYDDGSVCLCVVDDGRGFDLEHPEDHLEDHVGLASMQERTCQIGGHFKVLTAAGQGTRIEAIAPL